MVPNFSRFMQSFSRFIRDINGEKKISLLMIFSRFVFHGLPPLDRSHANFGNAAPSGSLGARARLSFASLLFDAKQTNEDLVEGCLARLLAR